LKPPASGLGENAAALAAPTASTPTVVRRSMFDVILPLCAKKIKTQVFFSGLIFFVSSICFAVRLAGKYSKRADAPLEWPQLKAYRLCAPLSARGVDIYSHCVCV
jgi:hypothetical protein